VFDTSICDLHSYHTENLYVLRSLQYQNFHSFASWTVVNFVVDNQGDHHLVKILMGERHLALSSRMAFEAGTSTALLELQSIVVLRRPGILLLLSLLELRYCPDAILWNGLQYDPPRLVRI
jgi:hypothetical protein